MDLGLDLIDKRLAYAERISLEPGMEHILTQALQMTIGDVMTRIWRTVRTNVIFRNQAFGRSELLTYLDGHTATLDTFFKSPAKEIVNKPIPIPDGMRGSYASTTSSLLRLCQDIAFGQHIKTVVGYFEEINCRVDAGTFVFDLELAKLRTRIRTDLDLPDTEHVTNTLQALFSTNKFEVRFARQEFKTKLVLKDVIKTVEAYSPFFQSALALSPAVDQLHNLTDKIITYFEGHPSPDQNNYLQALYRLVVKCAHLIDKFGLLLHEAQRVEHNFVLSMKIMVEA